MNSGIYIIFNLINGHFYVGSTNNFQERFINHFNQLLNNKHINKYLQHAFNKYGEENFEFMIIRYIEPTKEKLLIAEQEYLNKYHGSKACYNLTPTAGSNLGFKHSEKTKRKQRERSKGKRFSKEHIEKTRKINLGNKYCLGYKHTEQTKKKVSIATSGSKNGFYKKQHSKESIEKMRKAKLGKKLNDDHKKKLKIAHAHLKRPYSLISPSGIVHKGYGIEDFCRTNNLTYSHVRKLINDQIITYRGWKKFE